MGAQAEAMKSAASNTATGPMMAFAGMNMAAQAGGVNAGQLFQMGAQMDAAANAKAAAGSAQASSRPAQTGWTCACGKADNTGKFCSECGQKKPAGEALYRCDKCGWEPEDPKNPPKFCPECGDPFNDGDIR